MTISRPPQGLPLLSESSPWQDTWLQIRVRNYLDTVGKEHSWSYVSRTGARQAAVIVARTAQTDRLIIIRQFRIPLAAWNWEFPAGLVDAGETHAQTAIREFKEETGFAGTWIATSPRLITSSGLSDEEFRMVFLQAEEAPCEHAREASEAIEVHLLARDEVQVFLDAVVEHDETMDAKLYIWLKSWLEN